MARNVAVAIENSFVSGLITEATALNFPENAVTDTYNCVFDEKSLVTRRKGFDYEANYENRAVTLTDNVHVSYVWQSVAGDGDITIVVIQTGASVDFYLADPNASLSSTFLSGLNLDTYKVSGSSNIGQYECQFSSGNGYLFITHPFIDPLYIEFDPDTSTISGVGAIHIKIRDFKGLPESTDVDDRPSTLSVSHDYNLKNQGWPGMQISSYFTDAAVYPSNTEVWWLLKNADDNFTPSLRDKLELGNTPAPKGHYIFNAFYKDRSDASGVTGIAVESSGLQRPTTSTFFAGRVFYSGVNYQSFNTEIYFSQIVNGPEDFGKCHQANDPTSEIKFDLLASDGGVIRILDAGTIIKLVSIEGSLLVFASNGIWSISGSTGVGFTANDYSVKKISSVEILSASSFTMVMGFPVWWSADGIYGISVDTSLGQISVRSITDGKIKQFYNDIPENSKKYVQGVFDQFSRDIVWLFRSTAPTTIAERYEYDRVLVLNGLSQAYYPWSINVSSVKIHGVLSLRGTGQTISTQTVTDASDVDVVDALGDDVTVQVATTGSFPSVIKYIVSYNSNRTFAESSDADYLDWTTPLGTGVNYESYFVTGYAIRGEIQKKFQSNYVSIVLDNETPGTCYIQGVWDFATSGSTGRYSSRQRLVTTSSSYGYVTKRVKIRGHGKALQFKITSQTGEPFFITGWATYVTGNANI